MSEILFIRHAETDMAGTFCGHSDPGLNQRGLRQIEVLLGELAHEAIQAIYSSDLRRARATAEAIARPRGLEVATTSALREIDFGQWEGLTWSEIELRDPSYAAQWFAEFPALPAPSGELFANFEERALIAVEKILHRAEGTTAIVSHSGVMRVVAKHLSHASDAEAWELTKPYCSVIRYRAKTEVRFA
jgi:alpha-ribazole phosphatase/probable phosphoglycerate mutase